MYEQSANHQITCTAEIVEATKLDVIFSTLAQTKKNVAAIVAYKLKNG